MQSRNNAIMQFLVRVVIGVTLVWAGVVKMLDPLAFADAIAGFQIVPRVFINLVALSLPPFEILLGVALILGFFNAKTQRRGGTKFLECGSVAPAFGKPPRSAVEGNRGESMLAKSGNSASAPLPHSIFFASLRLCAFALNAKESALVATFLFAAFVFMLGQAVLRGIEVDCGCFGGSGTSAEVALLRALALFAGSLYLFLTAKKSNHLNK